MAKIEAFENNSDRYDLWFERNQDAYKSELDALCQTIGSQELLGLEVGVGSGKFAKPLGISIGVEPSNEMADKARALDIEVFDGVAEALPFNDGVFDYVLFVTTICFVDDVGKSFREAFRVLKSGGCVIVGFVDADSSLAKQYIKNRGKSHFYKDATFYSTAQLSSELKSAGFSELSFKQTLIPESQNQVRDGFGDGAFVVIKAIVLK